LQTAWTAAKIRDPRTPTLEKDMTRIDGASENRAADVQETGATGADAAGAAATETHDHGATAGERPGIGISNEMGAAGLRAKLEGALAGAKSDSGESEPMGPGSTGDRVRVLQELLAGSHTIERDVPGAASWVDASGTYDDATEKAVGALQQKLGLRATGVLDEATARALNEHVDGGLSTLRALGFEPAAQDGALEPVQYELGPGSSGPAVTELQRTLLKLTDQLPGVESFLETTGVYDEATEKAVRLYQGTVVDMNETGILRLEDALHLARVTAGGSTTVEALGFVPRTNAELLRGPRGSDPAAMLTYLKDVEHAELLTPDPPATVNYGSGINAALQALHAGPADAKPDLPSLAAAHSARNDAHVNGHLERNVMYTVAMHTALTDRIDTHGATDRARAALEAMREDYTPGDGFFRASPGKRHDRAAEHLQELTPEEHFWVLGQIRDDPSLESPFQAFSDVVGGEGVLGSLTRSRARGLADGLGFRYHMTANEVENHLKRTWVSRAFVGGVDGEPEEVDGYGG
jgi:peptidoglycan hydrolase-like protein with peptidoglycan-binding domain